MQAPPIPDDEAERLAALHGLRILDTAAEPRFDRITRLAARMFDVPVALISLVDAERQWFKSRIGTDLFETPRSLSFCGHAILQQDALVVEDALDDARFADNPLVTGKPFIRFYAGLRLASSEGAALGTLCLIDSKPRHLDAGQLAALEDLAALAANELNAGEGVKALIASLPEGVVVLDRGGLVKRFNGAAAAMFGGDADSLLGMHARDFLAEAMPNFRPLPGAPGLPRMRESVARRLDGGEFAVELSVSVMAIGASKEYAVIVRDISARKQFEANHRALAAWRSAYFASAAHELRTPMTSVLGFLDLMQKREFDPATGRELLGITQRQTRRLVDMVNDTLDLARIDAARGEDFDIQRQDLAPLVQGALDRFDVASRERFVLEIALDLPQLRVDAERLQRALANLLRNALQYSPGGAPVSLSARGGQGARGPEVVIKVADRGVGMTRQQQERMFDSFYRAHQLPDVPGHGLGMPIVREIITLHGGAIEVDSTPGQGTEVTIRLPAG